MSVVVIIDYGSGNLRSVAKAFERVAPAGYKIIVTPDSSKLAEASHIVLPGVGAFADCMSGLKNASGMIEALETQVREKQKPFLGICVGMQMLFEAGHEHGAHKGLGWLEGEVVKINGEWPVISDQNQRSWAADHRSLKIPHMGWNDLTIASPEHPLLTEIKTGDHAYFVHSYHAMCKTPSDVLATVDYGAKITAIVGKDNIIGTQFHPEKSQKTGLRLINNFLQLNG